MSVLCAGIIMEFFAPSQLLAGAMLCLVGTPKIIGVEQMRESKQPESHRDGGVTVRQCNTKAATFLEEFLR